MNFSDMNKEQKQKIVLLILVAVITVAAALYFGLTPLINKQKTLKAEIADVNGRIAQAERLLRQQSELQEELAMNHQTLSRIYRDHLPTGTDAYLWATEQVNRPARQVGADIESIVPRRVTTPSWETPRKERPSERRFVPIGFEVNLRAGYETFRAFIALLEHENPYVSTTQITISAQPQTPEIHRITMVLEWPRHLPGTMYPVEEKAALLSSESETAPPPVRMPDRRGS